MPGRGSPQQLDCDVCIIGAGPAGLTLADSLARRGSRVVLLESGRSRVVPSVADLNTATTTGDPLDDLRDSRARAVGGTSAIWSTIRRGTIGAKYLPLSPIDLEAREATPESGWPITHADLQPWYSAAHILLDLPPFDLTERAVSSSPFPLLPFPEDGLISDVFHWGPADLFGTMLPAALAASPNASVIWGATVTALDFASEERRITTVHWGSLDGDSGAMHADRVVLAAGAIENARLLLCMEQRHRLPASPWLGRGFMEHPIDRSLTLTTRHPALSPDPGFYAFAGTGNRERLIGRIGLSAGLMRERQLRNASLRLFPVRHPITRRIIRRMAHRIGRTPETTYSLLLDLEQAPHPDNRVTLDNSVDTLGVPRARLHWQWRESDEQHRQTMLSILEDEFARSGAGEIRRGPIQPVDPNAHHHAGTTRMHRDPNSGVVDADLRVHGVENLHVTGSSVFPTAGVANPTLTIVALSLRLAGHLNGGPKAQAQA